MHVCMHVYYIYLCTDLFLYVADHKLYSWGSAKRGLLGLGQIAAKIVSIPTVGEYI